ncbi:MAG: hypothetical protein ACOC2H_09590 [Spirochaetota bacterium]
MSTLDNVHKQVLNSILRKNQNSGGSPEMSESQNNISEKDSAVRQAVSELYMTLSEQAQPSEAIDLLADHVAMMVEMINEFKSKR